jgi:hypothetical protein
MTAVCRKILVAILAAAATMPQIQQANSQLASELGTTSVTTTDSSHNLMLYQPQLVADEIIAVVERVRAE